MYILRKKKRLLIIFFIFINFILLIDGATHLKLTESNNIEFEFDSKFTILRPYDLNAFIKQCLYMYVRPKIICKNPKLSEFRVGLLSILQY